MVNVSKRVVIGLIIIAILVMVGLIFWVNESQKPQVYIAPTH